MAKYVFPKVRSISLCYGEGQVNIYPDGKVTIAGPSHLNDVKLLFFVKDGLKAKMQDLDERLNLCVTAMEALEEMENNLGK